MKDKFNVIDAEADKLVEIYKQSYMELLKNYNELLAAGDDIKNAKLLFQEIQNMLAKLDKSTAKWIEKNIFKSYMLGYKTAYRMYPSIKEKEKKKADLNGIDKKAVEAIAYNMQSSLLDVTQKVGRASLKLYKQIGLNAAKKSTIMGEDGNLTKEEIIKTLGDNGLATFADKSGRNWNLDTYAELVAKTILRKALSQGTINRLIEDGRDLIQISSKKITCEKCAAIQGRIFSLSGKTEGYPKYENYIPVHPRCRHIVTGYILEPEDIKLKADFKGKLRGKVVELKGVKTQEIKYVKRSETEREELRKTFGNTEKKDFLSKLSKDESALKKAGLTEAEILVIKGGHVPEGWQVHHKLPLDDSGDNSFENLILIKNEPYHKIITNYQRAINRGLIEGEGILVSFPVPEGSIYPLKEDETEGNEKCGKIK